MFNYTALVTCLAILFYFFSTIQVSKARAAFGVKVPAISGNPDFERVFRAQMNTLEWLPFFLPSLWLFAIYISDPGAAVLGLIWIAGRFLYMTGYSQAAEKRERGFGIQALAAGILGKVRVQLTVDETGRVIEVKLLQGLGYGLDEAALAAARQASFEPALHCGKPERATVRMAFSFSR